MNNSLLLISLTLLGLASAGVFQHEIHRREGLKKKLIKEGRWEEYYALKQHQLHRKFSNFKSSSQNIGEFFGFEYYINVTIGTPDQLFSLNPDIGISTLLIYDITCTNCGNVRKFNSSKSSTYQKTDYYFNDTSGSRVYGQDFVRFGNPGTDQIVISEAMFEQVFTGLIPSLVDGIMGLGFSHGVDSPIITAVKSGILDNPVVTLFLRSYGPNASSNNDGVITYGAVDTVNCDRNIVYESLSDPNSFQVPVKKVSFGSSQFSGNWVAYLRNMANELTGPRSVVDAFMKAINASDTNIDCEAKFSLDFTIGSTVYTLTEKEMVANHGNNICTILIAPWPFEEWSFGVPWFKAFCNILDYGNKRVGFTKSFSL